jgi:hypothetical protein
MLEARCVILREHAKSGFMRPVVFAQLGLPRAFRSIRNDSAFSAIPGKAAERGRPRVRQRVALKARIWLVSVYVAAVHGCRVPRLDGPSWIVIDPTPRFARS